MNKIIIAGGGTGGHIFPAIAIANALLKINQQIEILFVGAKGKMEMEKIPQAGFKIIGIDIAGFNRTSLVKNISLPFKLIKSFFQVKRIIKNFKPDAVIGVGGYSSFPVLKLAQQKNIPTFIHESNSFAGKSNILLGKNATVVFVAHEGMEKFFPLNKLIITGNPVRENIANPTISRNDALGKFGLAVNKKTVLIVGGSLGASSVNSCIANQLNDFEKSDIQLIWQTGKFEFEKYKSHKEQSKLVWISEFITNMDEAYSAADVVISRAGAMAVTELCLVKKPVVFVPYPYAAEDHQTQNALYLVNRKAALIVSNNNVQQELVQAVINLCYNEALQNELKNNISKLAKTNASEKIAVEILKHLN